MSTLNPTITVRALFGSPEDKPQFQYITTGGSTPPFSYTITMKIKPPKGRKLVPITVTYGVLEGLCYAQASALDKSGTCVGCICKLLSDNQRLIWHLIQEKVANL